MSAQQPSNTIAVDPNHHTTDNNNNHYQQQLKINASSLFSTIQQPVPSFNYTQSISPIYQAHRYYSPFGYSTEEQLIQEINSLGQQISIIQQQLFLSKSKQKYQQKHNNTNKLLLTSHQSLEKLNRIKAQKQSINTSKYVNKKINSNTKLKSHTNKQQSQHNNNNNLRDKKKMIYPKTQPQKHNKFNPHHNTSTIIINQFVTQKSIEKQHQQQTNKKPIIHHDHHQDYSFYSNNTSNIINQTKKPTPKYNQNLIPSYNQFISKNIHKLLTQLSTDKQLCSPAITNITKLKQNKKLSNQHNHYKQLNQTISQFNNNQSLIIQQSLSNSRQKNININQSLFDNSRMMLLRKQQKINKYKQQRINKQVKQTTFQPMRYTMDYKSSNKLVSEGRSVNNFIRRQQNDVDKRRKNNLNQLKQVMKECSFQPRINVNSRHSQSIVKQIWRSTSLQKQSQHKNNNNRSIEQLQHKSIQKLKQNNNMNINNSNNINRHSSHNLKLSTQQQRRQIVDSSSMNNSKRSTLFNQSTQISVQDCKQLSFLLK